MFPASILLLLPLMGTSTCVQQNNHNKNSLLFEAHNERQIDAQLAQEKVSDEYIRCADGGYCPDYNTCCLMITGRYGCCPKPNAVCCPDKVHCCPQGYICDVSSGTCNSGIDIVSWMTKTAAKLVTTKVVYRDGFTCSAGSTCCQLSSGHYGSCPYPEAVCCSDKTHCCPNGYTCDVSAATCTKGSDVMTMLTKVASKPQVEYIRCADGTYCPDGNTCCQLSSGLYGCCPYLQAVCCSDKTHCCPNGYTCDVSAATCTKGSDVMTMLTKVASKPQVEYIRCADGTYCPDGNTCCQLSSGLYGCCPYLQAVCCSDKTHCCPNGYTCDMSAATCTKGSDVMTMLTKVASKPQVEYIRCADGTYCPDGNTCCQLSSGLYGCCPYLQAVCCSDRIHCCPNGYTCDVSTATCTKGSDVMTMLTKVASKPQVKYVECDDGTYCLDGYTCCQLSSGQYGCCPYPQAVCCSDRIHCCPNGYTCDVSTTTCTKGSDVMTMLTKVASKPQVKYVECDDGTYCLDGYTCCQLSSGQYGCCPYPQAVCCSDRIHCCPNGYTCDVSTATCTKGSDVMTMLTKVASKPQVKYVECDDGTYCLDGYTCCQLSSGQYGCCPYPQAVCCSDRIHCCPNGYTCDVSTATCTKGSDVMTMLTKVASKPQVKYVECDDGTYCLDGYTCCQLSSGQYGCCPYPQAVCCSDKTHCCPNGYTCDVSATTCTKGSDVMTMLTKVASKPQVEYIRCADGTYCPDGNTCCQLSSGLYGCCPYLQAVCCSDQTHCCPNGYTCDVSTSTCRKGIFVMNMLAKVAVKPVVKLVQCNDGSFCVKSCCLKAPDKFGCCPF